jgi:hypothetical protein
MPNGEGRKGKIKKLEDRNYYDVKNVTPNSRRGQNYATLPINPQKSNAG